jgi:imidazole glycerol-phosphate synthase subunit HisH
VAASVTLVDYGIGNIRAFLNIYQRLNVSVELADSPNRLAAARKVILPGVGAFDWAMARLNESGLRDTLDELVLHRNVPVLGVCVGMQMMAEGSAEGRLPGLGWIRGDVIRIPIESDTRSPLPHMGWNDVTAVHKQTIFRAIENPRFYFLHSYAVCPTDSHDILATTQYRGTDIVAALARDHIFGTQFHPEKSHQWGIDLLKNFASL